MMMMRMDNISAGCLQGVFDSSGKEKRVRGYIKSKVTERRWCRMASDKHLFYVSGPSRLTSIDWKNIDHQRSVAASLVQGVKVLELDRQEKRKGPEALAQSLSYASQLSLVVALGAGLGKSIFVYWLPSVELD